MKKKSKITEAEWPIMQVLWAQPTATAAEIVDAVTASRGIAMRTVKSLLRRLVAKGVVAYTVDGKDSRVYHYRALYDEAESIREKSLFMVKGVRDGTPGDMLAHFMEHTDLSREEVRRLRAILDKKHPGHGDG